MAARQSLPPDPLKTKRTALSLLAVVAAMVGLSFAAVPLYDMFCRVTGFGGTTMRAEPGEAEKLVASDREITIHFDANVAAGMPWLFRPLQQRVKVKVGEPKLAFYRAQNNSDYTLVGTSTFNVTPPKAGKYFDKVQCFCFTEQSLKPGESIEMPVEFFIDPKILEDKDLDDVNNITLSYTFFEVQPDTAPQN